LRENAQKLKEEKTTLEGMVRSCDELIMEMTEEYCDIPSLSRDSQS
jgi:hypothetical protein